MSELKDLEKLTVEERIKKLKEIAKQKKEEIENAQKLLKKSEAELEEKEEEKKQTPIPQMKAEAEESLTTAEEKDLFRTKRFEGTETKKPLEETVSEERIDESHKEKISEEESYRLQLSKEPARELYDEMKNLYSEVQDKGYVNSDEKQKLGNIEYAVNKKKEDIKEGSYNPSEQIAETIDHTQQLASKVKMMYKGH